jgi:hypothetical protein
MRHLAIHVFLALAFAFAPLLQAGASTIKGNVTDVNGNALTDGGYTIVAYYNDGSGKVLPLTSIAISTIPYGPITFPPAAGPGADKSVNLVYTHVATKKTRTLEGISSNCPNLNIDVRFGDPARTAGSIEARIDRIIRELEALRIELKNAQGGDSKKVSEDKK